MYTFEVLIVDDDPYALSLLKDLLNENYSFITKINEITDSCEVLGFLKTNPVPLVFLDIDMPNLNGLDLSKELREQFPDISFIFVTGHADYAIHGYETYPIDFLIKPVNPTRLERALRRFKLSNGLSAKQINSYVPKKISVRSNGSICFINIQDINYIEKRQRKCVINSKNNCEVECNNTLGELEKMLARHGFICPHQSFLVPISKIVEIKPDEFMNSYIIQIDNIDTEIRVSKNRYTELKKVILKNL